MQIADSGARSRVFRFKLDGRVREMGLGPLSRVSLGEARKLATGYRDMVRDLIDPILARREQQRRQLLDMSSDSNVTFRGAAEAFIRVQEPQWRNRKHVQQWGNTLRTYAYGDRRSPGARHRYCDDRADSPADLDEKGGDRASRARSHQGHPRCRDCAGPSHRQQPGTVR
ncbi:integrase arm-type DNA-binding domain-containing protein [Paraburkholderia phytofirmans]